MTRMSRGKIIVEKNAGDENRIESGFFAKADSLGKEIDAAIDEHLIEINPLRDGDTFAPPSAPWVGAENAWRQGIIPPPHGHDETNRYKSRVETAKLDLEDLTLTDIEVATVISTLPPPRPEIKKPPASSQLLKYAAVAAFTAVAAWAVFGAARSGSNGTTHNTVTPASAAYENASTVPSFTMTPIASEEEISAPTEPEIVPIEESAPARPARRISANAKKAASASAANPYTESHATAVTSLEPDNAEAFEPATDETVAETIGAGDSATVFNVANPYEKPEPEATTSPEAPGTLSRSAVQNVMESIADKVAKCGNGSEERIVMRLVVSGATGRVKSAEAIYAPYVNTPVGYCAARAVRFAKFPQFSQSEMTIKYPFEF